MKRNKKKIPKITISSAQGIRFLFIVLLIISIYLLVIISINVGVIFHNIDLVYNANRWCASNNQIYMENNLSIRCNTDNLYDYYDINKTKSLTDFYTTSTKELFNNHIRTVIISIIIGLSLMVLLLYKEENGNNNNNNH